MEKTYLFPWRDLVLIILTRRELTREEKRQVEQAFCEGRTPWGPHKPLNETVDNLKEKGLTDLADLIVIPSK